MASVASGQISLRSNPVSPDFKSLTFMGGISKAINLRQTCMRLNRIACTFWVLQRHQQLCLEQCLANILHPDERLCYIDGNTYDETPMVTTARHVPQTGVPTALPHASELLPPHLASVRAATIGEDVVVYGISPTFDSP